MSRWAASAVVVLCGIAPLGVGADSAGAPAAAVVAPASESVAGGPSPTVYYGASRQLRITPPRVERGPAVDGRLDDPVWSEAAVLDSFTHGRPIEDVPDTLGTQCLILYDAKNLYIGFRCADDPRRIQSPIVTRDLAWQGDFVCVSLDTWFDHQRSQFFCTNPSGIQMDGIDRDGADSDLNPDFLYTSRGRRNGAGWEVEMAIPFTSLRFPSGSPVTFGFNCSRQIRHQDAEVFWAPVTKNINSYHAQMGALEGLRDVRPGRNLELNPTFTNARAGLRSATGFDYDDDPRFGLGIKYGITSGLTADVAITPDFSQVEADAGVVDVNRRFAIFYPEKRPFFLEGSELFALPINLIYTRRIADPRYGVKLTGKVGRTSIGVINAADRSGREAVETLPSHANPYTTRDAQFGIVRVRHDVLRNSFVGMMAGVREQLDSYNHVVGGDARIHFDSRHSLIVQGAYSDSRDRDYAGPATRALPSGELAGVDGEVLEHTGRISQGGFGGFELRRDSKHLEAAASLVDMSRDFAADMGFLERTDQIVVEANVNPKIIGEGHSWFTRIEPEIEYGRTHDHEGKGYFGRFTDESIQSRVEVRFPLATWIGVEHGRYFTYFQGSTFGDQNRYEIWAGCERFGPVRGGIFFAGGDNVIFDEVGAGRFVTAEIWADLRFSRQFDGAFTLNAERDRRRSGTRFADVVIPRLRLGYQFTKELALRQITEWRTVRRWPSPTTTFDDAGASPSQERSLALDWLFSCYVRPGTVVYLGYGTRLEGPTPKTMHVERSNVFVKLSYLWQG